MDESAAGIAAAVRGKQRSAVAVTKDALALATALDPKINSFTALLRERALSSAEAVDTVIRRGGDPGPLAGVPFAAKNLYDIQGVTTLAGSLIDASRPAAGEDATLVARLEAAGAVLIGALNMDEYAYGFTTENSHYGPTRNPHDLDLISGGSSGGSAAAVAGGLVPFSLGSDTNGSIRVPAALCGVFGLKPTFGRLSRHGSRPFVHSLDHTGPFARSVADLSLVYDALQGPDSHDPACAQRPVEPTYPGLADRPPLRVGVLKGWFEAGGSPEVLAAVETVAGRLRARAVELPGAEAARAAAFCMTGAEGGSLHLDALKARPGDFDPATRDRLIAGALQPAHVLARAQRVRRWFLEQALALFNAFDVLLAPATPFPATPIGQSMISVRGQETWVRANLGLYTQPISFIGLPVLAAPMIEENGLPVGVQLIGAPWREDLLFQTAARLEAEGVVGAAKPSSLASAPSQAPAANQG